jgi:hypothetical protein
MQERYFNECMETLYNWTEKERADPNEHWQEKVDNLKCNPHSHEENPILKLYDIEGTK